MTMIDIQRGTWRACELYGDFWFNSEPVPVAALRGNVILIFFWDYTCSASLQVIPYVREWRKKYEEAGLVVVGVHTPRFPFARDPQNIQIALKQYGVDFPVVMDNEALIWSNYQNRSWPSLYVIDRDGFIRYRNLGEGNILAVERAVQALLIDAHPGERLPSLGEPRRQMDYPGALCYRATPELFAGYLKGSVGNVEGYSPESVVRYADPKIYMDNRFYLQGDWENGRSSFSLQSDPGAEGQVILPYTGVEVSGVFRREGEKVNVAIRQDDRFLTAESCGNDVTVGNDGTSFFVIDRPRMYSLVKNSIHGEHVLRLSTRGTGLVVYSFAFLTAVMPEFVSNN